MVLDVLQTLFGDANLDRAVDFSDFLILSTGFEQAGGWASGDFNATLDTTFDDFLLLSNNFGSATKTAAAVPEPSALLLAVLALLVVPSRGCQGTGN